MVGELGAYYLACGRSAPLAIWVRCCAYGARRVSRLVFGVCRCYTERTRRGQIELLGCRFLFVVSFSFLLSYLNQV
jgi:hypothetical protein